MFCVGPSFVIQCKAMLSSLIAREWVILRLNDDPDLKLSSVGGYLMLVFGLAQRGSIKCFSLALSMS